MNEQVTGVGPAAPTEVKAPTAEMAPDRKPCVHCGSEIPSGARLCPVCRSYQAAWRNSLTYAAGLTGFVTLMVSAIAFIVQQAGQIYKQQHWRDEVSIIDFYLGFDDEAPYTLVLANTGDGPVFASKATVYWRGDRYGSGLERIIPVNGIEAIHPRGVRNAPAKPGEVGIVANQSGTPSTTMVTN